ncbi:isochorismatase family protein [Halalkalibacterium halodurans]|nr:isochorismatase family protein [Halalkalibacterium halodurans]
MKRAQWIKGLVLCGIQTNYCVHTIVRSGHSRLYS